MRREARQEEIVDMIQDFAETIYEVLRAMPSVEDPDYRRFMAVMQDMAGRFPDEKKFLLRNSDEKYLQICSRAFAAGDAELGNIRDEASRYLQREFATASERADAMSACMVRAFAACGRGTGPERIIPGAGAAGGSGKAGTRGPKQAPPQPKKPASKQTQDPKKPDPKQKQTPKTTPDPKKTTDSKKTMGPKQTPGPKKTPGPTQTPTRQTPPQPPQSPARPAGNRKKILVTALILAVVAAGCLQMILGDHSGDPAKGSSGNTGSMTLAEQENWTHYAGGFVFVLPEGYDESRSFTNDNDEYYLQFEYEDSVTEYDTNVKSVYEERLGWMQEDDDYKLLDHGSIRIDGFTCYYLENEFIDDWWYQLYIPVKNRNRVVQMQIFTELAEASRVEEAKRVRDRLLGDLRFLDAAELESDPDQYYEACGMMFGRYEMLEDRAAYWADTEYNGMEGIPGVTNVSFYPDVSYLGADAMGHRNEEMDSKRDGGVTIRDSGMIPVDGTDGYWYDCIYADDNGDESDDGWEYTLYLKDPAAEHLTWINMQSKRKDVSDAAASNREAFIESLRFLR